MNMDHAGAGERSPPGHARRATSPGAIPAHLKVVTAPATGAGDRTPAPDAGGSHSDGWPLPDKAPVFQDLRRFRVPPGFRGRSLLMVAMWRVVQGSLFAWSPQPLHGWRRLVLRLFGARIGAGVRIMPSARVAYPWKLSIGDHAWIGSGAELYSLAPILIGAHAVISQRSYLCAAGHAVDRADFRYTAAPVVIGDQAWVAMDAMVGPGVTIGTGAVLGARSSAFHDIPPGVIAMGCPARPGRRRPAEPTLPGGSNARPESPSRASPSCSARAAAAASSWIRHGHAGPRQPG
ncbi:hypothetical protein GCM10019059_37250 [Camelimonas fluminis]|uniref:WcaF family extracellular polysaccharide biosynthesis acetyltransferase n=1 Tax=Camelimonas fluminis TaxID=1576911 RepID=A0ABV7UFT5_9HYPH|nr:WcaF family extracellular polysaccharide biosynthesis acetyltransferase [Camelimonas fluminis]GHE74270.1 hypothetical protein GCM10019059_37250 [Camelimonas fluminis]